MVVSYIYICIHTYISVLAGPVWLPDCLTACPSVSVSVCVCLCLYMHARMYVFGVVCGHVAGCLCRQLCRWVETRLTSIVGSRMI